MDRDRTRSALGSERLYAEWDRVGARLSAGICHFLNDRLMVVIGTIDLRDDSEPGENEDFTLIRSEIDRFEHAVRSLSVVFREPGGPRELLGLDDFARDLVAVNRYRRSASGVRVEVEGDPATRPVSADLPLLYRSALLLLSRAEAGVAAEPDAGVTVAYGTDGDAPVLRIQAHAAPARAPAPPAANRATDREADREAAKESAAWPATFDALRRRLAEDGIDLTAAPPPTDQRPAVTFTLRFRSAAAARR